MSIPPVVIRLMSPTDDRGVLFSTIKYFKLSVEGWGEEKRQPFYCFSPLIVITVCRIGSTFPDLATASSTIL